MISLLVWCVEQWRHHYDGSLIENNRNRKWWQENGFAMMTAHVSVSSGDNSGSSGGGGGNGGETKASFHIYTATSIQKKNTPHR